MFSFLISTYEKIEKKNLSGFLFAGFCLQLLWHYLPVNSVSAQLPYVFSASYTQLKVWYPHFYFFIYLLSLAVHLFLLIIKALPAFIFFLQIMLTALFSKSGWLLKAFIIIPAVLLAAYFPDIFWLSSLQMWLLYLYFYRGGQKRGIAVQRLPITENGILLIGVLMAFTIRLLWLLATDNSGVGDAGMRLIGMKRWVAIVQAIAGTPNLSSMYMYVLMPSVNWLPLHYYLVGIVSSLTGDWNYAPRILSAAVGALTLLPLYKLSKLKFNSETAFFAVVILMLYGYHIFLSTLVLSEVFYVFFVIWAYYFIERWIEQGSNKWLFYLALALSASCWLRYEGWFFAGLILFFLPFLRRPDRWSTYCCSAALVLLAMGYIMFLEVAYGVHPLHGILYSDFEVRIALANHPLSLASLWKEYSGSYVPLVFFAYLAHWLTVRKGGVKVNLLLFLYVAPMLPFVYKLANGTLTAQARYMTLYMVPLLPFVAHFLEQLMVKTTKFTGYMVALVFMLVLNILFVQQIQSGSLVLRYPEGFHKSALFVRELKSSNLYLDNTVEWGEFNWRVQANILPNIRWKRVAGNKIKWAVRKDYVRIEAPDNGVAMIGSVEGDRHVWESWNIRRFDTLLSRRYITHIMLFPDGELNRALKLSDSMEQYQGTDLVRIFDDNGYRVYAVQYK